MEADFTRLRRAIIPCDVKHGYRNYTGFFHWCKRIDNRIEGIKTGFHDHIFRHKSNSSSKLLFILDHIISVQKILKVLPEYGNNLERKFVVDRLNTLLDFFEEKFEEYDPFRNIPREEG